jgi:PAS domain S-box-containing protein
MISENFSVAAEDLLALFELTPDLVCIADKPGYLKNFNPAVINTLGYTREELLSKPISEFIHPEDREATGNRRADLLNGVTLLNFQNRYIKKSGDIVWLEWTSMFLSERELVFAIAKNITQRKTVEAEVENEFQKLRDKATMFKSNLERDRKYVAAELHEDLAQLATSVKVDLDWIQSNVQTTSESKKRIEHAFVTSTILVDTIRRISFAISPGMLDDLGLEATLEWYCNEFSSLHEIDCSFKSNFDEHLLPKEVRLDFFRICQEVLDHLKNHQKHKTVNVSIVDSENSISLIIDGFDAAGMISKGVISISERVESFHGQVHVEDQKLLVRFFL